MRAAFAIGLLGFVSLLLGRLSMMAESATGMPRVARITVGALVGLIAAAVTISIALDVVPDTAEGGLIDLSTVILGALAAIVLIARKLR